MNIAKKIGKVLVACMAVVLTVPLMHLPCSDAEIDTSSVEQVTYTTSTTMTNTSAASTTCITTYSAIQTTTYGTTETTATSTTTTSITTSTSTSQSQATTCETVCGMVISLSDADILLLAKLVELESGSQSNACKMAVASTVLNRMVLYQSNLHDVVYARGQYSVANRLHTATPSAHTMNAVSEVIQNGCTIPLYVLYFRAGWYHSWGDQTPYTAIDGVYFSYSAATKKSIA